MPSEPTRTASSSLHAGPHYVSSSPRPWSPSHEPTAIPHAEAQVRGLSHRSGERIANAAPQICHVALPLYLLEGGMVRSAFTPGQFPGVGTEAVESGGVSSVRRTLFQGGFRWRGGGTVYNPFLWELVTVLMESFHGESIDLTS
jgi:hypothetical protein